jgi:hypothetical protein
MNYLVVFRLNLYESQYAVTSCPASQLSMIILPSICDEARGTAGVQLALTGQHLLVVTQASQDHFPRRFDSFATQKCIVYSDWRNGRITRDVLPPSIWETFFLPKFFGLSARRELNHERQEQGTSRVSRLTRNVLPCRYYSMQPVIIVSRAKSWAE